MGGLDAHRLCFRPERAHDDAVLGLVRAETAVGIRAEIDRHARPSPASAPAGRSPAPPTPDAAGGAISRSQRLSVLFVLSCAPLARLACQRRPRNARDDISAGS